MTNDDLEAVVGDEPAESMQTVFLLAAGDSLIIEADLLVSPEFAGFLFDNGLAASDLTGADEDPAPDNGVDDSSEPPPVSGRSTR